MKQQNTTKLKKKELKSLLADTIEKTLKLDTEDEKFEKLRKTIRQAARQITKKYLLKTNNQKLKGKGKGKDKLSAKKTGKASSITIDKVKESKKTQDDINL